MPVRHRYRPARSVRNPPGSLRPPSDPPSPGWPAPGGFHVPTIPTRQLQRAPRRFAILTLAAILVILLLAIAVAVVWCEATSLRVSLADVVAENLDLRAYLGVAIAQRDEALDAHDEALALSQRAIDFAIEGEQ